MESRRLKYCTDKYMMKIPTTQIIFIPSQTNPFPLSSHNP
ncbi:hypothetical protein phiPA13_92 [Pseudomonas phage phiPA1-3]|nr:hypothetical protein phiPA13_92 [Pseudomonas phage phiPA1-3]